MGNEARAVADLPESIYTLSRFKQKCERRKNMALKTVVFDCLHG